MNYNKDNPLVIMIIAQACYGRLWKLRHAVLTHAISEKPKTVESMLWEDELKRLEDWWNQLNQKQRDEIVRANGEFGTGYKSLIAGYKINGQ